MDFSSYQKKAKSTAIYPDTHKLTYPALGLAGESGEVAEKIKKSIRDGNLDKEGLKKELGDVLWYVAAIANDMEFDLDEIAQMNLSKLESRKNRGVLSGSGDNR
jgi:NTP pyrophosphatase (non-canonical NTP hydrolase)